MKRELMPLFPSEAEIARAVLGERASDWKDKAVILDRQGLPPVHPLMGGRYWRAVVAFFDAENGVALQSDTGKASMQPDAAFKTVPPRHDGVETFHAAKPRSSHKRRARNAR